MNISFSLIENDINELIVSCYKRSSKSKDSLQALRDSFQKLSIISLDLKRAHPEFILENNIDLIINELDRTIHYESNRKKAEWVFDHYTDLYKYKAEELIAAIAALRAIETADQEKLVSKRKVLLDQEFSKQPAKTDHIE